MSSHRSRRPVWLLACSQCWNPSRQIFWPQGALWVFFFFFPASFIFIYWVIITRSCSFCYVSWSSNRGISPYHKVGSLLPHCGSAAFKKCLAMCSNNRACCAYGRGDNCLDIQNRGVYWAPHPFFSKVWTTWKEKRVAVKLKWTVLRSTVDNVFYFVLNLFSVHFVCCLTRSVSRS